MRLNLLLTFAVGVAGVAYGLVVGTYKTFPYSEILAIKISFSKENQWDLTEEQEINGDLTLVNTSKESLKWHAPTSWSVLNVSAS